MMDDATAAVDASVCLLDFICDIVCLPSPLLTSPHRVLTFTSPCPHLTVSSPCYHTSPPLALPALMPPQVYALLFLILVVWTFLGYFLFQRVETDRNPSRFANPLLAFATCLQCFAAGPFSLVVLEVAFGCFVRLCASMSFCVCVCVCIIVCAARRATQF